MAFPRAVPVGAGALAILSTIAVLAANISLSSQMVSGSSGRNAAIVSASMEAGALAALGWLISSHLIPARAGRPGSGRRRLNLEFALSVLLVFLAATSTIVTVVYVGQPSARLSAAKPAGFVAGLSVAVAISFTFQLFFLVTHRLVLAAAPPEGRAGGGPVSYNLDEESRRPVVCHVKSIPYSKTTPTVVDVSSTEYSPPPSSYGRSRSGTVSSIKSCISSIVRPVSSRSRLLSGVADRTVRRAASLDTTLRTHSTDHHLNHLHHLHAAAAANPDDGFDTWDTSSVDPESRKTVMEILIPTPSQSQSRLLETIPASPIVSRTPSPGELEPPPRIRARSRSYSPGLGGLLAAGRVSPSHMAALPPRSPSPASAPGSPQPGFTLHSGGSEAHIHPLFRSDSPVPPPAATPGTVVTAAPDAGRVISDRQSIRSLRRIKSGSLSGSGPGPLGNLRGSANAAAASCDALTLCLSSSSAKTWAGGGASPPLPSPEERKMTPPIPDWVLTAGSRPSPTWYHSRRANMADPVDGPDEH